MPAKFSNRAWETSTTTGTGTLSLAGRIDAKHKTLKAVVGTGSLVSYIIVHRTADEYEVGWGIVTSGSPDTLSRLSVEESSNSDALVSLSSGTKDVYIVSSAAIQGEDPGLCQFRLSLTSGIAVTITDVTGSSANTIYAVPYKGCSLSLYNGTRWKRYTSSQLTIAVPASNFRIYDVFVWDNAGTLELELTAWDSGGQTTGSITGCTNATPIVVTSASHGRSVGDLVGINGTVTNIAPNGKIWYLSNTTTTFTLEGSVGNGASASGGTWYLIPVARTTGLTLQDGVYMKSGDLTRRYLGTFMTGPTSGQTEDSANRRLLWNYYNQTLRQLSAVDTTDSWSYTTNTWRPSNANTDIGVAQCWLVTGLAGGLMRVRNKQIVANASAPAAAAGVGLNRCAANVAQIFGGWTHGGRSTDAHYTGIAPLGFSFVQRLENSAVGGTSTWYGDSGVTVMQCGMIVEVPT